MALKKNTFKVGDRVKFVYSPEWCECTTCKEASGKIFIVVRVRQTLIDLKDFPINSSVPMGLCHLINSPSHLPDYL